MRHIRQFGVFLLTFAVSGPVVSQEPLPSGEAGEAAVEGETLDRLAVRQWVQPEVDGVVRGSVVAPRGGGLLDSVPGVSVALADERGTLIRAETDSDGSFELVGAEPGIYGLFVVGENVAAAYAMNVLPPDDVADQSVGGALRVPAGPIHISVLRRIVRTYLPGGDPAADRAYRRYESDPLGRERVQEDIFRVAAQGDGSMIGRLEPPRAEGASGADLGDMNVMIVEDDQVVARSEVDADGSFRIEGLRPGIYALVAAGRSGFAVLGFELSAADATAADLAARGEVRLAAHRSSALQPGVNLVLAPPEAAGAFFSQAFGPVDEDLMADLGLLPQPALPPPPGFAGGGFGPGGGGGGLGGGGGGLGDGGIGGLLGLAGLAAGVAALADDDERPARPASPRRPAGIPPGPPGGVPPGPPGGGGP